MLKEAERNFSIKRSRTFHSRDSNKSGLSTKQLILKTDSSPNNLSLNKSPTLAIKNKKLSEYKKHKSEHKSEIPI